MKCLLVDDEPGIREGLAALLRRRGHEVCTAGDCAAACAALRSGQFDVVVTDWRLPDGLAASFLVNCAGPVVAISGHPEEVVRTPGMVDVLTKPVAPSRLVAALEQLTGQASVAAATRLPLDVREVVDDLLRRIPPGAAVELHDDGVFVVFVATLPARSSIRPLGGQPRWVFRDGAWRFELTLCRDGRPDSSLPSVRAGAPWPVVPALAVDFHDSDVTQDQFVDCLDRARQAQREGRRTCFLNVDPELRSIARSLGRIHDMPMKATVGPRLSAELADLWSDP